MGFVCNCSNERSSLGVSDGGNEESGGSGGYGGNYCACNAFYYLELGMEKKRAIRVCEEFPRC